MNLVPEWKWLIRKTWSIRLVILSALLSGFEVILPLFVDTIPRNLFAALSMCSAIAAGIARVVAQPKMERRSKPRARPDAARADYD
jgi:hypothetical protein